ncbi:MAG: class I SAM-dependent methyltransferase [Acidobacteriota bacterium]|nr:class I SAM-dependent methyltransferase [Acidobacteriota bacterium]
MNTYEDLAAYYDYLVTSGYYDYERLANAMIVILEHRRKVLDLGMGTALLASRLLERRPDLFLHGIDISPRMLELARKRLGKHAIIHRADVRDFDLGERFEAAFSSGGVWNFIETATGYALCSHLQARQDNEQGLKRVTAHLEPGGIMALSCQGEHHTMELSLADGIHYRQIITPMKQGFGKDYFFERDGRALAAQRIDFRMFPYDEAEEMMETAGLERMYIEPQSGLHVYRKRHER